MESASPALLDALKKQVAADAAGSSARHPATGQATCMVPYPTKQQVEKWEPKRLTPKHRQILSLYAQGMKREEIGSLCKCTPQLVTMLAGCLQGKEYLAGIEQAMDTELKNLYGASVSAIREQLQSGSGENKLKAAKLQMQAIGKLGKKEDEAETAEDVIQRIMNMQVNGDLNVTINNGSK